ncbi:d351306d-2a15-4d6c-bc4f-56e96794d227 [Thermothielavioides terrestris]|uniref:D351306d-2a15-4d6c-bc4f-56e96794d227 n=1 Tax=Thermothielavioides terrestris TaxID=2587410 RepID=A0A446BLZ5_9PEZI|nr:d351306d-2a15-4d6c-bc4f-56e96794d227 [Thermothielavioides terrestris]
MKRCAPLRRPDPSSEPSPPVLPPSIPTPNPNPTPVPTPAPVPMASASLNSAGDPPPPAMEPGPRFFWSLERLPAELLQPIAEGLIPQCPLTTRFALRPSGTWEFRDASHQWADWLVSHHNLLSFAQTSRRMAAIARPLLYHTLVIPTARALVLLFRRVNERPEIGPWIRSITCLANVAGAVTVAEVHREWERQAGGNAVADSPAPRHVCMCANPAEGRSWNSRQAETNDYDPRIGLELLKAILLKAPNLRDFLLACPDHDLIPHDAEPPDQLLPNFRDAVLRYRTEFSPAASEAVLNFVPLGLMRNLTSLRIYCHREDGDRQLTLSRLLADHVVETLQLLPHVKTLELCCASADKLLAPDIVLPPLPHIEHLRLYGSHIHEPRLVALCLACVNLQSLVVHFESSSTDEDRDLLPEGKTLNEALAGLAGSLRTLELVALSEGHYLTRGRERPRKPENHRLTCIPELVRLDRLTLDYRGVFGTLGILEEDDGERLCQLLPPSLRDFTLVCEWGTARDWKQSYLANLDMVLHGVECLCASPSHRLSSISLAIHSWPAESRFHRRFKREVEAARQRCARAGILFRTFDLLPSYQDEDEIDPVEEEEAEAGAEGEEGQEESDEAGDEDEHEVRAEEELAGHIPPEEELELEEEDEASEYYVTDEEESDPEREARRPPTFNAFLQRLGDDHGHSLDELFYAYHEDRWDEYLF